MIAPLILRNYFRSSASYRVRICLSLKGLAYEYVPVPLKDGAQYDDKHLRLNPQAQVPTLIHGDKVLSQSMAILDYLDELAPDPNLYPRDRWQKAKCIELCEVINSGIQPLQNLAVTQALSQNHGFTPTQVKEWIFQWVSKGLNTLEKLVENQAGSFAFEGTPGAFEAFLIPQLFSSRRFDVDLGKYPTLLKIEESCLRLEAFEKAHPQNQPDSPK